METTRSFAMTSVTNSRMCVFLSTSCFFIYLDLGWLLENITFSHKSSNNVQPKYNVMYLENLPFPCKLLWDYFLYKAVNMAYLSLEIICPTAIYTDKPLCADQCCSYQTLLR